VPSPKPPPAQSEPAPAQSEKDDRLAVGSIPAIAEKANHGRSAADRDELATRPPLPRFRCDRCGYGACCRMAPERCPMCGGSTWSFDTRFRNDNDFPLRRDPSL
jgi:rubrerythrin